MPRSRPAGDGKPKFPPDGVDSALPRMPVKRAVTPTYATNFADVHLHEGSGEPAGGRLTGDELLLGIREPEAAAERDHAGEATH